MYKQKNEIHMAKFTLTKKKLLEERVAKISNNSIILLQKKNQIQQLERDKEFSEVLKETNKVLENYLNSGMYDEIRRAKEMQEDIDYNNKEIYSLSFASDIEQEFAQLDTINLSASHLNDQHQLQDPIKEQNDSIFNL